MWLSYHHFNLISIGWSSCSLKFHMCGEVDLVLLCYLCTPLTFITNVLPSSEECWRWTNGMSKPSVPKEPVYGLVRPS